MIKWIKTLSEPFMASYKLSRRIRSYASVGAFVWFFLFVFRPFGLAESGGSLLLTTFLFGSVTFIVCTIYDLITTYALGIRRDIESWTMGRWLLVQLLMITLIGVGNYLCYLFIWGDEISLRFLMIMIANTLAVGVLPLALFGTLGVVKSKAKYGAIAQSMSTSTHRESSSALISFALAGEQVITVDKNYLLYLEAQQNYVVINCWVDGEIIREKVRATLKMMMEKCDDKDVVRCHRSFAIHTPAVDHFTGNAQGLRIHLKSGNDVVPVSRSYIATIKALLAHQN